MTPPGIFIRQAVCAYVEAAELYDLKMENAVIIRKAARDLMAHSIKTPTMTYHFMVLKDIPKNEKLPKRMPFFCR